MFKVIWKTALKTVLAVIIVAVIAFTVVSLAFPQNMADFFESCGNYSFATGYASLRYNYTGDIDDLARCFQDSVRSGSDKKTAEFGDKLISADGFDELCDKKSGDIGVDYRQYVYGKVACAKYGQGDLDGALKSAAEALDGMVGFPVNNALAQLALSVIEKRDGAAAEKLQSLMESHADGSGYYSTIYNEIRKI